MASRIEDTKHTQGYTEDSGTLYDLESGNDDNLYSLPDDRDDSEEDENDLSS